MTLSVPAIVSSLIAISCVAFGILGWRIAHAKTLAPDGSRLPVLRLPVVAPIAFGSRRIRIHSLRQAPFEGQVGLEIINNDDALWVRLAPQDVQNLARLLDPASARRSGPA